MVKILNTKGMLKHTEVILLIFILIFIIIGIILFSVMLTKSQKTKKALEQILYFFNIEDDNYKYTYVVDGIAKKVLPQFSIRKNKQTK